MKCKYITYKTIEFFRNSIKTDLLKIIIIIFIFLSLPVVTVAMEGLNLFYEKDSNGELIESRQEVYWDDNKIGTLVKTSMREGRYEGIFMDINGSILGSFESKVLDYTARCKVYNSKGDYITEADGIYGFCEVIINRYSLDRQEASDVESNTAPEPVKYGYVGGRADPQFSIKFLSEYNPDIQEVLSNINDFVKDCVDWVFIYRKNDGKLGGIAIYSRRVMDEFEEGEYRDKQANLIGKFKVEWVENGYECLVFDKNGGFISRVKGGVEEGFKIALLANQ